MNGTRWILGLVLADFVALSAWAVSHHGYIGVFEALLGSPATITVFVDLGIALTIILTWMRDDARQTGRRFWPYVALTGALGSVGPLLYLLVGRVPRPANVHASETFPLTRSA